MNKETILGFIRHILTFGGGFIVAQGHVDITQLETAIGAIVTLAGIVWSAFDKKTRV